MTQVLLAPTLDLARSIPTPDIAVEAEYGSAVVEGSVYTAAHHQPGGPGRGRPLGGGAPPPCNDTRIPALKEGAILVSHLDLDTIGGCLRAMGSLPVPSSPFWRLAEFVDVRGAHKLGEWGGNPMYVRALHAWWAWAKTLPRFPRDAISDVTETVFAAGAALHQILVGFGENGIEEGPLLLAGDKFREEGEALNRRTFRRLAGTDDHVIVVRVADDPHDFCNHLYTAPDGTVSLAVASLNTSTGAVTISLADPIPGVSCRDIVQVLWGPEAGGHAGIAGSPRGQTMTVADLDAVVAALTAAC